MMRRLARGIWNRSLHFAARQLPGSESVRPFLHRLRGVKIGRRVFIGDDVYLENEYPERVEIHDGVQISVRAIFLAHTRGPGQIIVERNTYIGANAVVTTTGGKTLRIGEGSVIGAGVVITRDVPARSFIPPPSANPVATVTVPLAEAKHVDDFVRGLIPLRPDKVTARRNG